MQKICPNKKKIRNWTSAHFYTFSVRDWVRPETAAVLHFSFYINTLVPLDYTPVNQNPGISIYRGNKWRKSYRFMTSLHLHLFLSPISVMERREYLLVLIYFYLCLKEKELRRQQAIILKHQVWADVFKSPSQTVFHWIMPQICCFCFFMWLLQRNSLAKNEFCHYYCKNYLFFGSAIALNVLWVIIYWGVAE